MRRNSPARRLLYAVMAFVAFVLLWKLLRSEPVPTTSLHAVAPEPEPPGAIVGGKAVADSASDGVPNDLGNKRPGSEQDTPAYDPASEYELLLRHAPVVIFSKSYCPFSKQAKHILLELYDLSPPPFVVEFDLHDHGHELQQHVGAITGRSTVPNVHVSSLSRGGGDDITKLHESGQLKARFEDWAQGQLLVSPRAI